MGGMRSRLHHVQYDRPAVLEHVSVQPVCLGSEIANQSNAYGGAYQNASSNHPGGANFLFCDGSVKFVKATINMRTYWCWGPRPTAR